MELLTMTNSESSWRPTISLDGLMLSILMLMADGSPRISSRGAGTTYSEANARMGFERVAKRYKWDI